MGFIHLVLLHKSYFTFNSHLSLTRKSSFAHRLF